MLVEQVFDGVLVKTVLLAEFLSQFVGGDVGGTGVVLVEVPEERIEGDVSFDSPREIIP